MSLFEETSGTSGEDIYSNNSWRRSAWNKAWGIAWGFAWGFIQDTPFLDTDGSPADEIFEQNSGTSSDIFGTTSGSNPDPIYEEN